jgi:hypothetical protein
MKEYAGVDPWIHIFLTSALAGGEFCQFHASTALSRGKEPPVTIG